MLSLAGIKPPEFYHGKAFAGAFAAAPREYNFGFRGRMDERYDLMRSVRDKRYIYIWNYNPHKIYGQHLEYMWSLPSTPAWEQLYKAGKLKAPQTHFWETKPPEELYDLQSDPDEINNLAASPEHRGTLERFRKAHHQNELAVRDVGLLPEGEMHARAGQSSPFEMGHDPKRFPLERILAAADLASSLQPAVSGRLEALMQDGDSAVRYWGVMGVLMRGPKEVTKLQGAVRKCLKDSSPYVRIAACEALGLHGTPEDLQAVAPTLIELANSVKSGSYAAIQALNAVDTLGPKMRPWKEQLVALPAIDPASPERVRSEYTARLIKRIGESLS